MELFEGQARNDLQFLIGFNREPRGGGGGPPSNNDSSAIFDHNSGPCDDCASELGTSLRDDDGCDFNDKLSLTMLIKILKVMISYVVLAIMMIIAIMAIMMIIMQ